MESLIKLDEGSLTLRAIAEFDNVLSRMDGEFPSDDTSKNDKRTCFDFVLAEKNWKLADKIIGGETGDQKATAAVSAAVDSIMDANDADQNEKEMKQDNVPLRMLFAFSIILRRNTLGLMRSDQAKFLARYYVSKIEYIGELQNCIDRDDGGTPSLSAPPEWLDVIVGRSRSELLALFDRAFDSELIGLEAVSDHLFNNCVALEETLEQNQQGASRSARRRCRNLLSLALTLVESSLSSSSSKKMSRESAVRLFTSCLLLSQPGGRRDEASSFRPDEFVVLDTIKDWFFEKDSHSDDELSASPSSSCVQLWALVEIIQAEEGTGNAQNTKRTGVINEPAESQTGWQHVLLFERAVVPSFLESFVDISIGEHARKLIANSFEVNKRRQQRRLDSGTIKDKLVRASTASVGAIFSIVDTSFICYTCSISRCGGKRILRAF